MLRYVLLLAGVMQVWSITGHFVHADTLATQPAAGGSTASVEPAAPAQALPSGRMSDEALQLLLEKAQFWFEKGRPDVAIDFYKRILTIDTTNEDALVGAAKVSLDLGQEEASRGFTERLRKVAPDDPWLNQFDSAKRRSKEEAAVLSEARHLAVLGQRDQALAKYRTLFPNGQVPKDLAAEYYPLYIASLPEESVEANDALTTLQKMAEDDPKDLTLQLAAGQAMVSLEGSRAEGIERLHQLSHNPVVAHRARAIWRQALLWQGADFQAQDQLEEYLKENPTDPELEAKRAEYRASLPNPGLRARMNGYEAVRQKDAKTAEKFFQDAIDYDATDADAVVMMAVVRQMQGRTAEWQALLNKAIGLAPDRKQEFLGMLGADPVANAKAAEESSKAIIAQYKEVARLADSGKFDEAEKLLRSLIGTQRNAGSYIQLSDIQARAGHLAAAESSLRTALAAEPDNADANIALAGLLNREGKTAESAAMLDRAEAGYAAKNDAKGLQAVHSAKADRMRQEALKINDLAARQDALRKALAMDPSSWWIRLEMARTLRQNGHGTDAQAQIDEAEHAARAPGALETQSGRDALQVAFIWAQERNDTAKAQSLADLIPVDKRPAAMRDYLAQLAFKDQVERAAAAGPSARMKLLEMAAQPDPTGARGQDIGRAFVKMADLDGMHRTLNAALKATPAPTTAQRIAYANLLVEANDLNSVRPILAGIDPKSLTPAQASTVRGIFDSLAVAQADQLMQDNKPDQAAKLLEARLAHGEDSVPLKVAAARASIAEGHADTALPVLMTILQQDPSNGAARSGAIEASIQLGYLRQADELVTDGISRNPQDPFLLMQAANIAQARGDKGRALEYLLKAKAVRATQADAVPVSAPANAPVH